MLENKEKIATIIKDLNKNIIFIDRKLGQLFNFMIIDNKKKLDIELTITFFNNIYNDYMTTMTNKHDIDIEGCESANTTTYGFIKSYSEKNNSISTTLNDFNNIILKEKNNLTDYDHIDKSHVSKIIQINELFIINYINKISNEEAEKLFKLKLYFVEKVEYYENITKLYPIQINNQLFFHVISSIIIVLFIITIKTFAIQIYNYLDILLTTSTNIQCNNALSK
jgi:hypothetical protein